MKMINTCDVNMCAHVNTQFAQKFANANLENFIRQVQIKSETIVNLNAPNQQSK